MQIRVPVSNHLQNNNMALTLWQESNYKIENSKEQLHLILLLSGACLLLEWPQPVGKHDDDA